MQVKVAATDTAPAYSYKSGEVHKFLTRWCFFAAGLTPSFVIAWYIMHVSERACLHRDVRSLSTPNSNARTLAVRMH